MAQRGRKSAAANLTPLPTTGTRSKLIAPAILTTSEKATFTELANANPHLTTSDAPLLATYAQALNKTHRLGRTKDLAGWEKAAKLALALARSLRLTAQAGNDPKSVARARREAEQAEAAWELYNWRADGDGGDDDDE
jgi:hypothetical protein